MSVVSLKFDDWYVTDNVITEDHFGSVVRGNKGDVTIQVPGSGTIGDADEVNFTSIIDYLGVTTIRWPGGTEAERGLVPDADDAPRSLDWEIKQDPENYSDDDYNFADLMRVIDYCSDHGLTLSFTVPVSDDIPEESTVDSFINAMLSYAEIKEVVISSISIGNEPTINGLTPSEYGQSANQMTGYVGSAVADYYDGDLDLGPKIVLQAGNVWNTITSSDYNTNSSFPDAAIPGLPGKNGKMDLAEILEAFNSGNAHQYLDAIDIHQATLVPKSVAEVLGEVVDEIGYKTLSEITDQLTDILAILDGSATGADGLYQKYEDYERLDGISLDWDASSLEIQSLAWQYPYDGDGTSATGASLENAAIGFVQMHEMAKSNVTAAMSWLATSTNSVEASLSYEEDGEIFVNPGGELFRMMRDNLVGAQAVELQTSSLDDSETITRIFEKDGQVILYVANRTDSSSDIELQGLNRLLGDHGIQLAGYTLGEGLANLHIWGSKLGATGGTDQYKTTGEVDLLTKSDLQDGDWKLGFSLGAHEIMQIVISTSASEGVEITGHDKNDLLDGSDWNDTLEANGGNDSLDGGTGNDILTGGSGADTFKFSSGDGLDRITDFNPSEDILVIDDVQIQSFDALPNGVSAISTSEGVEIHYGNSDVVLLEGLDLTPASNVVDGTEAGETMNIGYEDAEGDKITDVTSVEDVIYGYGGDDKISGGKGADTIYGGEGDDIIYGNSQSDALYGEAGNDELYSGKHGSLLDGGAGDDHLYAHMGNTGGHTLTGGEGADRFEFRNDGTKLATATITDYDAAEDKLYIDETLIDLTNPASGYIVSAANGGTQISYGDGNTILLEGVSVGSPGGTPGVVDGTEAGETMNIGYEDAEGDEITDVTSVEDVIYGYGGDDKISGGKGADTIYGGEGNDIIYGNSQSDVLYGEAGNDELYSGKHGSLLDGGAGDDHLYAHMGNTGGHTLTGGEGADTFEFKYDNSNKAATATITDFNAVEDTLIIDGNTIDLNNLPAGYTLTNVSGGIQIDYGTSDSITILDL
ncbi:calcium-binding protein [Aliiroseovarius marinus]|uniref:calcium-binding protein n=1 Tax=Aliiroseovarius marinus TaxID=2500159 RepID=UPI003D7CCEDB